MSAESQHERYPPLPSTPTRHSCPKPLPYTTTLCPYPTPRLARVQGHGHVAALLLQHRASTSAATAKRASPLHLASRAGHMAVAALLLADGASPAAADANGDTPLHQAATTAPHYPGA